MRWRRTGSVTLGGAALAIALGAEGLAAAPAPGAQDPPPVPVVGPDSSAPPSPAASVPAAVAWRDDWPRFRVWEYAGTVAAGVTSFYFRRYRPPPPQAKWQGDNWFDDQIRSWLRAETPEGRRRSQYASDRLAELGYVIPFGIDLTVALFAHGQLPLAWQMLMMDLEAFAVSGLINNVLFYQVGRGRPSAHDCAASQAYDDLCAIGANASLPSGHVLTIATGAGLACVHHRYLPLFGRPWADASACGFMVAATLATAVTRIMADRHYASDDLVGIAIGFGAGYGLPWLLHYRYGAGASPATASDASRSLSLFPMGGRTSGGLGLVGLF
ncbi:MAG TPA: phosphatase PAP2 family protein [Polyangia bacterium]